MATGRRAGVSTLELVITIPIVLMLGFGLIEYGYFIFTKTTLQAAARDGARQAIFPDATNTTVSNAVARTMRDAGLQGTGYTVTTEPPNVSGLPTGTPITVTVSCTWGSVGVHPLPVVLGGIPTNKQVASAAAMSRE